MIHVTPDPNNVGSSDRRFGGGIVDVHLDGAESGGIGIHVQSHSGHCIRVHTSYFTNVHFLSDVLSNDLANGPQDVQDFVWDLVSTDVNTANEADALVVINGSDSVSPAANTSIGFIPNMRLMAESSAVAMHLGNCDALTFGRVHADTRTAATGDGGKIIAHATDTLPSGLGTTSADGRSRHLHFDFVQSPEGFVAKDTVSAGTAASAITIDHYSLGNGAELPTEEAAAHQISYRTSGGDDVIRSVSGVIIDPIHSYGGTANAIQITTGAELSEIPTGMRIRFKATAENTGATTIQVDSAPSASAETVIGMPLPSGYIRTDVHTEAFFDGTNWVVDREDEIILGAGGILARYANGQQLCGAGIPLSYFSGLQLIGSWAYNADFASVPIISGSIDTTDFNSNVTPNLEDCTGVNNGSSTVSGCSLNIRRAAGTTNFASGDVTTVQLSAVGVWYLPY